MGKQRCFCVRWVLSYGRWFWGWWPLVCWPNLRRSPHVVCASHDVPNLNLGYYFYPSMLWEGLTVGVHFGFWYGGERERDREGERKRASRRWRGRERERESQDNSVKFYLFCQTGHARFRWLVHVLFSNLAIYLVCSLGL